MLPPRTGLPLPSPSVRFVATDGSQDRGVLHTVLQQLQEAPTRGTEAAPPFSKTPSNLSRRGSMMLPSRYSNGSRDVMDVQRHARTDHVTNSDAGPHLCHPLE